MLADLTSAEIQAAAQACGFEIAGVTRAAPHADFSRFRNWSASGRAAAMTYLTDHRGELRADPRSLLPTAQSIICLGKLYASEQPFSTEIDDSECGWIARYAWRNDYHEVLRPLIERLIGRLVELRGAPFASRICIDTAPLLERSYAHAAGLGWIGKNTCLINQSWGSWFYLAEILVDLALAPDAAAADRCGTCTRCIDACPTQALVPNPEGGYDLDAALCIAYLTIEKRGPLSAEEAAHNGRHVFGCDICQEVCPWNLRARLASAPEIDEPLARRLFAPSLIELAGLNEEEFRRMFRSTPIWRSKYSGFLRNVAAAMGNSGSQAMLEPLAKLVLHPDARVAEAAQTSLGKLRATLSSTY